MFPDINGLRLTVLQDKEHEEPTANFIQILETIGFALPPLLMERKLMLIILHL